MDVARKCGLRDVEPAFGELAAQLILIRDGGMREKFPDCGVPLKFHLLELERSLIFVNALCLAR